MRTQCGVFKTMRPTKEPRRHRTMGIFLVLLLSMVGASIGAVIFLYGAASTPESTAFIRSPEFITWMFVNEVIFALYPISIGLLWRAMRQLGRHLLRHKL